jgi:hypothetical protein
MKLFLLCLSFVFLFEGVLIDGAGASGVDKAAMQKITADCKAQTKQYAQYNETSWYQRRKMTKNCVNDAVAKKG